MAAARSETSSQTLLTAARWLTSSPESTTSGIGTPAFPRSVTLWPRSSSAASMRAQRMALGPMSTPLRSWPRSIGTPKRPTGTRSFSGKGDPPRTSWVGRSLEAPCGRPPHGVDPAEEHVGSLVAEHALVVVQVGHAGARLVGEKVFLSVEAWGEDCLLQRQPEIHHVYYGLEDGRGYARGAWGTECDQA